MTLRYSTTDTLRHLRLAAIGVALVTLCATAPAHAVATNTLEFEANYSGGGLGGNLTDAEIATLIGLNEAALGVPIDLIVKVTPGGAVDQVALGFEGIAFESFVCTTGAGDDCQTGFTLSLDFSAVGPFQIVKLAIKAGNNLVGVFSLPEADDLQSGELDTIQAAFVSDLDRILSCGQPGGDNGCSGVSNILVFVAPAREDLRDVPEPATLTLLGLGLVGAGAAARRKYLQQ